MHNTPVIRGSNRLYTLPDAGDHIGNFQDVGEYTCNCFGSMNICMAIHKTRYTHNAVFCVLLCQKTPTQSRVFSQRYFNLSVNYDDKHNCVVLTT